MRDEIKRSAELWLAHHLAATTGLKFTANHGGSDPGDTSGELIEPQGVVQVTECECIVHGLALFQVTVVVGYMSHMGDAEAAQHSDAVRKVEDAILTLPKGYYAPFDLNVHGTDLRDTESFGDEEDKVRGDAFTLTMGVSH